MNPNATTLLEFYGITKELFVSKKLQGDLLERFINYAEELDWFVASVVDSNENCGIIGEEGSGKSSFLLRLEQLIRRRGIVCIYRELPHGKPNLTEQFLRTVLREIVLAAKTTPSVQETVESKIGVRLRDIEVRLEATTMFENLQQHTDTKSSANTNELNIKLFKTAAQINFNDTDTSGTREQSQMNVFTESTLGEMISRIAQALPTKIVLLIDELDKVGRDENLAGAVGWDKELWRLIEICGELIANNNNLTFVFALQKALKPRLDEASTRIGKASPSGLIQAYKELPAFNQEMAYQAVEQALACAGYQDNRQSIIQDEVIDILHGTFQGNPRQMMNYLSTLAKNVFVQRRKRTNYHIGTDDLKSALEEKLGYVISEADWNTAVTNKRLNIQDYTRSIGE